jgi:hypothetical protein
MKLAACLNIWADSVELLPYCVQNLINCGVDGIIIVWSEQSNYGEIAKDYIPVLPMWEGQDTRVHIFQREPVFHHPMNSETDKRNYALDQAKRLGYTHFLTMDQDEFYEPAKFKKVRNYIEATGVKGIVCPSRVYFKSPKLTIGKDTTLVPFIHEIQPGIRHEFNRRYPYAWDDRTIRIDPTRSLSIISGVEYTEEVMLEHYSYVRKDIKMKIRNSSAKANIERSTLLNDYEQAKEGFYVEFYKKTLSRSQLDFGIPEFYEPTESSKSSKV